VASAKAACLLYSGSIVKEIGRISTENGVYCVTQNGCGRFVNQTDEVYLKPVEIGVAGPLYASKGDSSKLYIRLRTRFVENNDNVLLPGALYEGASLIPFRRGDEYVCVLPSISGYLKASDVEQKKLWAFTFPSTGRRLTFVDMRANPEWESAVEERVEEVDTSTDETEDDTQDDEDGVIWI